MTIPLLDLTAQYRLIKTDIDAAIAGVLESGVYIQGPKVFELESAVASYVGVRHGIGVANGTDALILALEALGIGPGDEVIVPVYTFFATAEAVSRLGATPVFVDIDPKTCCIDPAQIEARITPRTKAVIPVHLYGHPADMTHILELAARRGLKVIEDNAQALGTEYEGRKTGSFGDAACLSFFPTKNLGAFGDGGMVLTNDSTVAETVRRLRSHGWKKKYFPERIGYNSRLDALQAAVLRVKLNHLDRWISQKRRIATVYQEELSSSGALLPQTAAGAKHSFHLYVIRVRNRDVVESRLNALGIATAVYYPMPLHQIAPYRPGSGDKSFPEAEVASGENLAIPIFPEMTKEQIVAVVAGVKEVLGAKELATEPSRRSHGA